MSNEANPYFARSLVNRYWKHFFKRGLIEPEDDIRDTNPPSNPELLDALARHFIASGYDLKSVIRLITQSQSLSTQRHAERGQRGRSAEFLAILTPSDCPPKCCWMPSTSLPARTPISPTCRPGTRAIALPDNSYNKSSYFLAVFGRPEGASVCECERVQTSSLAQSLYLMNGQDIKQKLAIGGGRAELLAKATRPEPGENHRALPGRLLPPAQRPRGARPPPNISRRLASTVKANRSIPRWPRGKVTKICSGQSSTPKNSSTTTSMTPRTSLIRLVVGLASLVARVRVGRPGRLPAAAASAHRDADGGAGGNQRRGRHHGRKSR